MSHIGTQVSPQLREGIKRVARMRRVRLGDLVAKAIEDLLLELAKEEGWAAKWERAWGEPWRPEDWIGWPVVKQATKVDWRRNPRMWYLTRQDLKVGYKAWMNGRTLGDVVEALRRPTREKLTKEILLGLWEGLGLDTRRREKYISGKAKVEIEAMKERWPVRAAMLKDIALIVAQERGINLMAEAERILGPDGPGEEQQSGEATGSGDGEQTRSALRLPE